VLKVWRLATLACSGNLTRHNATTHTGYGRHSAFFTLELWKTRDTEIIDIGQKTNWDYVRIEPLKENWIGKHFAGSRTYTRENICAQYRILGLGPTSIIALPTLMQIIIG